MIGKFNDIKEISNNKFTDSPLGKNVDLSAIKKYSEVEDKSLVIMCDNIKYCPLNNGRWDGERGNSTWYPDKDVVPKKKNENSEKKNWGEILKEFKIEGITFKDGEPDFEPISKGTVEIKDFKDDRDDNFDKADIELAKKKGCLPEDVYRWRKENGYTWHECMDMKTIQKVPSSVHNNISHQGGISKIRERNKYGA